MRAQKIGRYLVRFCNGRAHMLVRQFEISPHASSNQHEESPHGNAEERADRDAAEGAAIRLREQVALD